MGRRMRNARHHGPTHAQQQRDGSITDAGRHSGMSRRRNGEWWRIRRHREPIAARGTLRGARWDLQRLFHRPSGERQYCWRVPWTPAEGHLRRRCDGRWAAEGEAQTTAAHRSAQRAVQEMQRKEELRRRGELDEAEAVEHHYEYEEYNNTSPSRSRSRSRAPTPTRNRPTDEVEEEWSWEVRSHSE